MELELAKAQSQVDHLKSQNEVLELTMEDAKTTNEKFSINLARHESNATALQLALAYADQVLATYVVLTFWGHEWHLHFTGIEAGRGNTVV